jgi:hypothetical protein
MNDPARSVARRIFRVVDSGSFHVAHVPAT